MLQIASGPEGATLIQMTVDPLVAAIRAGQPEAWRNAYIAHSGDMRAAAAKVLRSESDRDDAVQEAISSVMKSGLPEDISNLRAYLCQATRFKAYDIVRKQSRLVLLDEDDGSQATAVAAATGSEVDPADVALDRLDVDRALACRTDMNDKQWTALEQRLMLDRPARDVAAELDVEPQRVSQLVKEAIAIIRKKQSFDVGGQADFPLRQSAASGPEGEQ